MDYSKMQTVRLSPHASAKVMFDHFREIDNEQMFCDANANSIAVAMSAGALCLYSATLLTKVHETQPQNIKCECSEREQALIAMIKQTPKYSSFTDEQVQTMAHGLILKDIRNSFAHGNFELSFDPYSKRLFFVLKPRRKDFIVDKPIIISKEALFDINRLHVGQLGLGKSLLSKQQIASQMQGRYGEALKKIVLPVDMLRLAENYLDNKVKHFDKYRPAQSRYLGIYYPLLVSQMTYEQDEYYNLYHKDSNIFAKIALIRNAISHNGFAFDSKTFDVTHTDRLERTTDPLEKSVRMLKLIRDHKNLISLVKDLGINEQNTEYMVEKIKAFFDSLFVYGGYEQEEDEEAEWE